MSNRQFEIICMDNGFILKTNHQAYDDEIYTNFVDLANEIYKRAPKGSKTDSSLIGVSGVTK